MFAQILTKTSFKSTRNIIYLALTLWVVRGVDDYRHSRTYAATLPNVYVICHPCTTIQWVRIGHCRTLFICSNHVRQIMHSTYRFYIIGNVRVICEVVVCGDDVVHALHFCTRAYRKAAGRCGYQDVIVTWPEMINITYSNAQCKWANFKKCQRINCGEREEYNNNNNNNN